MLPILQSLVALTMAVQAMTAQAQTLPQMASPPSVEQLIIKWANYYDVDVERSLRIAKCESNYQMVYGDHGNAYGVYQFWRQTFDSMARELGEPLDYFSTEDQVRLANWAFSRDYYSHWTCK